MTAALRARAVRLWELERGYADAVAGEPCPKYAARELLALPRADLDALLAVAEKADALNRALADKFWPQQMGETWPQVEALTAALGAIK